MAEENNIRNTEVNTESTGANTITNAGAETKPSTPSFDEMLKQGYQAEFDRRVSKAIETAKGKFTDPKVTELEQKLTGYMQRESVTRAGVRPEFTEFVTYSVNAAGGDFDEALTKYLEANPQYKASAAPQSKPNGWGQPQNGGNPSDNMDGVERRFRELNPNLKL